MRIIISILALITLVSCLPQDSIPTTSSLHVAVGDILVSSNTTDSVHQFDKEGNYKRVLWRTTLTSETIGGIGWMESTNEILIAIDGTPDRVVAVSVVDGGERVLINNSNISGTVRGVTQLKSNDDIIVSEGTGFERASSSGVRKTYGSVWPNTVMTNVQDFKALDSGGFIAASSSAGVKTFADSTSTALTASSSASAPTGTTGSYGVAELPNGNFIASWEGAGTDIVCLYDSNLTYQSDVFPNNQGYLSAPRGVAVKENGNFLVADNTLDYVLEFDENGNIVKTIGQSILDGAYSVFVVPSFSH